MKKKCKCKKKKVIKTTIIKQFTGGDIEKKHKPKIEEEIEIFEDHKKLKGNKILRCDDRF